MDKIELEILGLSSSHTQTGSFALVLGEVTGNRRLPIIIGMFEAQAIAIEIEKITPNRPMTHDLFKSFADGFGYSVQEIMISKLREGVFFAQIIASDGEKLVEIDARPSDAIAIGIRFNVPVFTNESIMSEAGIVLNEGEEEEEEETEEHEEDLGDEGASIDRAVKEMEEEAEKELQHSEDSFEKYSKSQLEEMLDEALHEERYEEAAKIRDELNKRG